MRVFLILSIFFTSFASEQESEGFFENPVLPHQLDSSERSITGMRRGLEYIMSLGDEEILARMPVQVPRIHNGCPNCRKGQTIRHKAWDYEQPPSFGNLKGRSKVYDPKNPDQYTCPDCGEVFPNNPKFPQSEKAKLLTQFAKEVEVRYYLDPNGINYHNPNDSSPYPRKYYQDGVLDTERHNWINPQLYSLAKLYHLTGDKEAGHRALVILNAYADLWPTWLYNQNYGHGYGELRKDRLEGWGVMTREGRRTGDEINGPANFMNATDLMIGTDAFTEFEKNKGINLKYKLWNNVIAVSIARGEKVYTYKEVKMREFGQACPTGNFVQLARVFNRPELIRNTAIRGLDYTPRICMGIDGSFIQGTGYGQIHLGAMSKMGAVNGYSDPPGFTPLPGGKAIKAYRYPYGPHEEYWMKAYNYLARLRMPDGGVPVTNDGEHQGYITWIPGINTPIRESKNLIAHGYKYAILGDGRDDQQIQLHLNYSPNKVGHGHADTLTPQLFAFGHYLMDDSEYCKTNIRNYSGSTAGHNTVVINHASQGDATPLGYSQALPFQEGSPQLFEGRTPGVRVISVDAARAYQAYGVTKYQRTLLMNTYEPDRPYVVDIFQVKGGTTRDYMLRSSYQHDSDGETSFKLKKMQGLTPLLPEREIGKLGDRDMGSCYRLFFDVSEGSAETGGTVDYRVKEPWKPRKKIPGYESRPALAPVKFDPKLKEHPVGTRHHVIGQPNQKAYFFGSPDTFDAVMDSKKSSSTTDYENWKRVPHFMLRYEVENPEEETTFIVVHEPWLKDPKIQSVQQLESGAANLLALEIKYSDRTDTVFWSLDGKVATGKANGIAFSGRVGLNSEKGEKRESLLVGGIQLGNLKSDIAQVQGDIIRSYRKWNGDSFDGFRIKMSEKLPASDSLQGSFAVVKNNGPATNITKGTFLNPGLVPRLYHLMKRDLGDVYPALEAIYAKKDTHHYPRYEGYVELAKKVKGAIREMDAGWGFVIDHVEKDGNELIVYTDEDHGLDIAAGHTSEFSHPMRHFDTPNQLTIYTSVASQSVPRVSPAGGVFMKPIKVTLSHTDAVYAVAPAQPVWDRYGKPVVAEALRADAETLEPEWIAYKGPITVSESSTLLVKGMSKTGYREQIPRKYAFALPSSPIGTTGEIQPGLKRQIRKAYFDNRIGAFERRDGRVRVPSIQERLDSGEYRFDEPMIEDIVSTVDAKEVIDLCIKKRMQAEMTLTGFLKTTEPGIYKFYYRPHHDGDLFLNGKQVVYGRYETASPMPYAFEVPLEKGLIPLEIVYRFIDGRLREGAPTLEFEWVKPDGTREFVPPSAFVHSVPHK